MWLLLILSFFTTALYHFVIVLTCPLWSLIFKSLILPVTNISHLPVANCFFLTFPHNHIFFRHFFINLTFIKNRVLFFNIAIDAYTKNILFNIWNKLKSSLKFYWFFGNIESIFGIKQLKMKVCNVLFWKKSKKISLLLNQNIFISNWIAAKEAFISNGN